MIQVNIEDIKPGMILAQSVRNRQGVMLLESGSQITGKSIRIFKSWGVNEIAIKGDLSDSSGSVENVESPKKETIEKQLRDKFSGVLDDPLMVAIYEAARKRLMHDLQTSESDLEAS